MGKRSAVVELFLGDMGSMQRELRPSTQREDQLTMETKLEQIAVKAVNQLPKSVVREIRTPRSVGAGGGRPPPATRWARGNSRPYRERGPPTAKTTRITQCMVRPCGARGFDIAGAKKDEVWTQYRSRTRCSACRSQLVGCLK
ncbi:hypothetical protein SAMN05443247_05044 [Bradyrhizobium erythrophlei]|nr:hypothetical protein SAMN05443247_05044 [Bradyrhizobium erythrophlei]